MRDVEVAALKFALLALDEVVKTASKKKVYDNTHVAVPFRAIAFPRALKMAILRIARDYGLVRYSTAWFDDEKNVRVVVIDLEKLNNYLHKLGESGGSVCGRPPSGTESGTGGDLP